MSDEATEVKVITDNEYAIGAGQNLPNHSTSMNGRGRFVRQTLDRFPTFRTKQQAYRYAAWIIEMAGVHLPDEAGAHTFEQVREAIQNT